LVSDRRPLLAIGLILLIAVIPSFFLKRPTPPPKAAADSSAVVAPPPAPAPAAAPAMVAPDSNAAALPALAEDTVVVRSDLYRLALSTRGGRIISSRFLHYKSLDPASKGDTLELLPAGASLLDARLAMAGDTVRLNEASFTASTDSIMVTGDSASVTFTGQAGAHPVTLRYSFHPGEYRIGVTGTVGGMDPAGGTMYVGLGDGFRNTEADPVLNYREGGLVTKLDKTHLNRFSSLKPRQLTTYSGPFEWVAVKSKYFVAGVFAMDTTRPAGAQGLIGGVTAFAPDTTPHPIRAEVNASLPVKASGDFTLSMYLGPMEYDRLKAMGHQFDDVNPYGWAWLRPIIRPFAVLIRWVFVEIHQVLGLGYGLVIVLFGIMVRILLWPLNQKAMRSMMAMQAIQPELQAIQARYKEDPQRLQQEMFKLYKENNVNPFGGCWPMLLPYPLLVAVFFVLAYTIEVRGVHFLWMTDLARPDPYYIIPVVMAVSMFGVSKIGQMGLPPNPQAKMMMYLMPGMMLFLFANFASGLNLYYAVQNLASIPQQWMIAKERQKLGKGKVQLPAKKR
jgi:YidC/Oxa1 family membrane protein insertase